MNAFLSKIISGQTLKDGFSASSMKTLGAPILIVLVLAMLVLPLPTFALDMLFSFNIAISIVVLLATLYTKKPLEFSSFPTILLVTTLLRLSLNVASTRIVLLDGHEGGDAAGKVIEAFGQFLVGGNLAVGIIVFTILVIINFVVITKGSGRIAEVAARFALDAMPGKQMAIDADMNAGLIGEDEARRRRIEVSQEAEFYGSMDGASKFVRGDAIASILILFINIIGGLIVGVSQHDLSMADAGEIYVILAIGDGLVAQIPGLMISIAAGLVISRVGQGQDIGTQIGRQLFNTPQALGLSAVIVAAMGVIPGMPNLSFLLLAAMLGLCAWYVHNKPKEELETQTSSGTSISTTIESQQTDDATWHDVKPVEEISIELGYRLIPLISNKRIGDLTMRIKSLRKKFASQIGFLPPVINLRDNLELDSNRYNILIKGVVKGKGDLNPTMLLALNPGGVTQQIEGEKTVDPTYNLPAVWISENAKPRAIDYGYTVTDPCTVLCVHLEQIILGNASVLFGRQQAQEYLDRFKSINQALVDEVCPKLIDLATLQRVLQNLLEEGVHILDIRTILEAISEKALTSKDPAALTSHVRLMLSPAIVQAITHGESEIRVMFIDPALEQILVQNQAQPGVFSIDPNLSETITSQIRAILTDYADNGVQPPALVVPDSIRSGLAKMLTREFRDLSVLANSEIPDHINIRCDVMIGSKKLKNN